MNYGADASEPPLIQRPIDEILAAARAGGRRAIPPDRHALESIWENACFAWIETAMPESLALPNDVFRDLVDKVRPAFMAGLEDVSALPIAAESLDSSRLPGIGYWFSEENSYAFGLTADLSCFYVDRFDADALYHRFHARLFSEYDRLALQVAIDRDDGVDVYPTDPEEDIPLSISTRGDDTLYLQIVPAAIDRATLAKELPAKVKEVVDMLSKAPELNHE